MRASAEWRITAGSVDRLSVSTLRHPGVTIVNNDTVVSDRSSYHVTLPRVAAFRPPLKHSGSENCFKHLQVPGYLLDIWSSRSSRL